MRSQRLLRLTLTFRWCLVVFRGNGAKERFFPQRQLTACLRHIEPLGVRSVAAMLCRAVV